MLIQLVVFFRLHDVVDRSASFVIEVVSKSVLEIHVAAGAGSARLVAGGERAAGPLEVKS